MSMRVHFSRWGNSLALRIPAPTLRDIGAREGMQADLAIEDGRLIVTPVPDRPSYTLEELVKGITRDNLHEDLYGEAAFGSEEW